MNGLNSFTDEDLCQIVDPKAPRMTVGRQIERYIIGHGYSHLGEVRFIKGLQGMPFPA